jgi:hypothetical protein
MALRHNMYARTIRRKYGMAEQKGEGEVGCKEKNGTELQHAGDG